MMKIVTMLFCLAFAAMTTLNAQEAAKPVVLSRNVPMRSGTVLRELFHINVERGITRVEAKSGISQLSTRWMHRYNLVRRVQGAGAEEVDVREHVCQTGNFTGNLVPGGEDFGPLSSKTMRARRRANGWEYLLKDGKATASELNCLLDLGFASGLLEIIPAAIGTQPRKIGETWKADIQNPRGKAHGLPVLQALETTFGSVENRDEGPHAHLFITGSFTVQRPLGYNASLEVSFAVALTRRLADMLDVETKITGNFKNTYAAIYRASENAANEPATFVQDLPYTLTRTLKIEAK